MHVKLFVYHPTLLCYSMLLGNNYSTLIHSFDRGFIIYIYSPIPHFRNLLFDHSFLTEGIDLSVFYKTFFYHFSLPYQSMLLGGDGCCMSNFSFVILHCSVPRKMLYPHSLGWEEIDSSIKICIYINISFKNIFYHPSCLSHSIL